VRRRRHVVNVSCLAFRIHRMTLSRGTAARAVNSTRDEHMFVNKGHLCEFFFQFSFFSLFGLPRKRPHTEKASGGKSIRPIGPLRRADEESDRERAANGRKVFGPTLDIIDWSAERCIASPLAFTGFPKDRTIRIRIRQGRLEGLAR
jgi:hypothetical protein